MSRADSQRTPPLVGIVGGLASGKSTVAHLLGEFGAAVIDADSIGHDFLESPTVKVALVRQFGQQIADGTGGVDRERLAEKAFDSPAGVEKLNAILHPPIIRELRRRIEELMDSGEVPLIVLDAALLVETGLHESMCDALLYVQAPRQVRRRRAFERNQMTPEQFEKRNRAQIDPEEKEKLADFVVSNSGSLRELAAQVRQLWPQLVQQRKRAHTRTELE